jgi:hypothetical protein
VNLVLLILGAVGAALLALLAIESMVADASRELSE